MMFIAQGWIQGSGLTSDWSECSAIEREPGRAMLAVKFEIRNVSPSSEHHVLTGGAPAEVVTREEMDERG